MKDYFISKRFWIRSKLVSDKVLDAYTLKLFDEAHCKPMCSFYQDRPCSACDSCPCYKGTVRLYKEKEIDGKIYYGFPANNPKTLKKLFHLDSYWKIPNLRPKIPFSQKDLKFTGELRTGQVVDGIQSANQVYLCNEWLKKKIGIIVAPARTGKTVLSVYNAIQLGCKTVVLAHKVDLLRQFYDAWKKTTNIKDSHIKLVKNVKELLDPKIDVALVNYQKFLSVDTMKTKRNGAKKLAKYINDRFSFVVADECFVAGTKVNTPSGLKNIEDIRPGDKVYSLYGVDTVSKVFVRNSTNLIRIKIHVMEANNRTSVKEITCTREHPFFTQKGFTKAESLSKGDELYSIQDMQELQEEIHIKRKYKWSSWFHSAISANKLLQSALSVILRMDIFCNTSRSEQKVYDNSKSVLFQRSAKEDDGNKAKEWHGWLHSAISKRRKWTLTDDTAKEIEEIARKRLEMRSVLRKQEVETSNRSRWNQSFIKAWKAKRQEKRQAIKKAWVESVTSYEQESGRAVYNLEVKGHPSYFVEGVLVHNCHSVGALGYYKVLMNLKCRYVLGLTATPDRKDSMTTLVKQAVGPVVVEGRSMSMAPLIVPVLTHVQNHAKKWMSIVRQLCNDKKRQDIIIDWLDKDLQEGRQVIIPMQVVSTMYSLRDRIYKKLEDKYGDHFVDILNGKTDREANIKKFDAGYTKVLIASIAIIKQGIDFKSKNVNTMYNIVPMSASGSSKIGAPMHYQQTYRICSPVEGKKQPIVRWFIDDCKPSICCARSIFWKEIVPRLKDFEGQPPRYKMTDKDQLLVNDVVKRRSYYD